MPASLEDEPILEIEEIQAHVLPGFQTPYQHVLGLRVASSETARTSLRALLPRITSAAEVLAARSSNPTVEGEKPWMSVGFSYGGLLKLTDEAQQFTDRAFKDGMMRRSLLLGDPMDEKAEGHPNNWVVGGPGCQLDVLLVLGGNGQQQLARAASHLTSTLGSSSEIVFDQPAAFLSLPTGENKQEHFGFHDNISQPGIRGRLSEASCDVYTPRRHAGNPDQGWPGQQLIWPGEFIFGYPGQDPMDKRRAGPVATAGPAWGRNGSLLVFRRLRQDVKQFRRFLETAAAKLGDRFPALAPVRPRWVAAKLMGRWPSGAPLLRTPEADNSALGRDRCANNHFTYITSAQRVPEGGAPACPDAEYALAFGDPNGEICPHAAHIRRAYPRDASTFEVSEANIETHRLLRRAIPFGSPYPEPGERGMLFLAYQTSLERQFEFVTRAWLNNPNFPSSGAGHDPIAGQNFGGEGNRTRTFTLSVQVPGKEVEQITLELSEEWVIPTGGGYFFVPSLSALHHLARSRGAATTKGSSTERGRT